MYNLKFSLFSIKQYLKSISDSITPCPAATCAGSPGACFFILWLSFILTVFLSLVSILLTFNIYLTYLFFGRNNHTYSQKMYMICPLCCILYAHFSLCKPMLTRLSTYVDDIPLNVTFRPLAFRRLSMPDIRKPLQFNGLWYVCHLWHGRSYTSSQERAGHAEWHELRVLRRADAPVPLMLD